MSGDHNQYQKPDGKCRRCGEVNPAYIHTCTPKQHWSDCAVHSEPAYPAGECDCGGVQPEQKPAPCPFPCGWKAMLSIIAKDGAFLARSLIEGEPVTGHQREIVMRLIDYAKTMASHGLSAPPQQEPPCKTGSQCIGGKCERCAEPEPHQHGGRIMTMREIMEAEDCEPPPPQPEQEQDGKCQNCDGSGCVACDARHLPQPEQQPAAWGIANTRPTEKQSLMMVMLYEPEPSHLVVPLYTAPPQREWQGLTDEEIREFEIWLDDEEEKHGWNPPADIVKHIEAKLKEKNT